MEKVHIFIYGLRITILYFIIIYCKINMFCSFVVTYSPEKTETQLQNSVTAETIWDIGKTDIGR